MVLIKFNSVILPLNVHILQDGFNQDSEGPKYEGHIPKVFRLRLSLKYAWFVEDRVVVVSLDLQSNLKLTQLRLVLALASKSASDDKFASNVNTYCEIPYPFSSGCGGE